MAEIKDTYESIYENQDAATQQKLSQLQSNIKAHVETVPLQTLGNSVMSKDGSKKQLGIAELISAGYGERISRDVIMKYITGSKNEKTTFW